MLNYLYPFCISANKERHSLHNSQTQPKKLNVRRKELVKIMFNINLFTLSLFLINLIKEFIKFFLNTI